VTLRFTDIDFQEIYTKEKSHPRSVKVQKNLPTSSMNSILVPLPNGTSLQQATEKNKQMK
jgi:hypothetical protein